MPPASNNLLVVEDEPYWCDIYLRAGKREKFDVVRIAQNLQQAEKFIWEMQFAVAFIDIGLNITDDQNVDGLRVMGEIRDRCDPTSIVVVTGRSGRDVLPITRDVIKKYDAIEIIGKTEIDPPQIRSLLREGLVAFIEGSAAQGVTAEDTLRGSVPRQYWDDQMLRAIDARNGVHGLHIFLEALLGEFLPLVASNPSEPVTLDRENALAHGLYWSRATGQAVAVFYGRRSAADQAKEAESSGLLLGRYHVDALLKRSSAHGLTGAVFALKVTPCGAFGDPG
jgi:hypothetical protein